MRNNRYKEKTIKTIKTLNALIKTDQYIVTSYI